MPTTLIGAFSSEIARIAPMTAAPPAMSSFIRSMPSAGLMEMPPVSNVMPLPTSPSTGEAGAPGGLCVMTITRGGSALPRATPSSRPMLQPLDLVLVEDLDRQVRRSRAMAAPRSAKTDGVRTFAGSLQRSRAMFDDSPRMRPRSTASLERGGRCCPAATTTSICSGAGPLRSWLL